MVVDVMFSFFYDFQGKEFSSEFLLCVQKNVLYLYNRVSTNPSLPVKFV